MKEYIYNPTKEPVPAFIKQFEKQVNLGGINMKVIDFLTTINRYNAVVKVIDLEKNLIGEVVFGDIGTDYDDIDLLNSTIKSIVSDTIDDGIYFYSLYVK